MTAAAESVDWGADGLTVAEAVDSDRKWRIRLSPDSARECGTPRVVAAGRLARLDEEEEMRDDGYPAFYADELYLVSTRSPSIPPAVVQLRLSMGGSIEATPSDLELVFGPREGVTREEMAELWAGWGKHERLCWIRRKEWAARRMTECGVPDQEAATWSASYAAERMAHDARRPF